MHLTPGRKAAAAQGHSHSHCYIRQLAAVAAPPQQQGLAHSMLDPGRLAKASLLWMLQVVVLVRLQRALPRLVLAALLPLLHPHALALLQEW